MTENEDDAIDALLSLSTLLNKNSSPEDKYDNSSLMPIGLQLPDVALVPVRLGEQDVVTEMAKLGFVLVKNIANTVKTGTPITQPTGNDKDTVLEQTTASTSNTAKATHTLKLPLKPVSPAKLDSPGSSDDSTLPQSPKGTIKIRRYALKKLTHK